MTGSASVLALDAGQTAIKARLERPGAAPVERVLPGVRTDAPLLPQLADAVRAVAGEEPIGALAVGTSGLTSAEYDADALRRLVAPPAARVLLTHDSVTSFLGALGDGAGAVVAAGTGVVALAVGAGGVARVDGWGHIMGDAGSGYWIGREALDAVMRAHDGRGPATALSEPVRARWPELEEAYVQLQGDPARVSVVASFAAHVAALADADEVAAGICRRAAEELAHSVVTALRRASGGAPDAAPVVSAIGGVLRSALIRRVFEEAVRGTHLGARFAAPRGTGLDGAAALPALADGHPLRELVAESCA